MTVFPDKKGEPRGLTAFSCSAGRALWTLELPRSARYNLTSKEQSRLFSRIVLALVATAVSASHPMTYGGSSYAMVVVPNVHVSDRAGRLSSGERSAAPASVLEKDFPAALDRYNRLAARLVQRRRAMRYLPTGPKGKYEIQRINYQDGSIEPVVRYEASPVHAIYTDPGFEQAISLENDKRRLRLVSLSSTGDGVHEKTEASREE